jgi:hypothetical protein
MNAVCRPTDQTKIWCGGVLCAEVRAGWVRRLRWELSTNFVESLEVSLEICLD